MVSGEVVIQSMWSPAVTAVRSQGVPCIYQNPKEGYRCWSNCLYLGSQVSGMKLDAIYEYFAWYHESGFQACCSPARAIIRRCRRRPRRT